jgi:DNA-binding MarR family transcriptional regulator
MSITALAAALRAAARANRTASLTVRALAATIEVNTRGEITQVDLRALLGTTEMQTSRAIASATRAGLIRRAPRRNGTPVLLCSTADGRRLTTHLERSMTA